MLIEIKNRWDRSVILEYAADENSVAITVKAAIEAKISLSDADLSDADLRGADLSGADLSGADLSGADLSDANLRDADLRGADLRGADLSDANLRDADLRGANLRGANLRGADLRGADLSGADLSDANVDYSFGWKFSCSCSRFKIGMRLAYQVLAHLCSCKSDDPDFAELLEKILPYALKSHRAEDLGLK